MSILLLLKLLWKSFECGERPILKTDYFNQNLKSVFNYEARLDTFEKHRTETIKHKRGSGHQIKLQVRKKNLNIS